MRRAVVRDGKRRESRSHGLGVAMIIAAVLIALPLAAQTEPRAGLRMSGGPYYAEVPIEVQIVLEGFDEEPRPEVVPLEEPRAASLTVVAVSPQISTTMSIVNGRMSQSRAVTWTASVQLIPEQPGPFALPALEVRQGARSVRVEGRALVAVAVPVSDEIGVEVGIPERPVYVGQWVRLAVTMRLAERLASSLGGYTLRSELFDRESDFDFIDPPPESGGKNTLNILAGGEALRLPARVARVDDAGRPMLAVTADRLLVPLRAGTYEVPPASLLLEEVTRWQRGAFAMDRRAAETRLHLARDLPRRLVVKEVPTAGRPRSFAGAVGSGFSLLLEADRSVVRAGDPITFTLTLRGDGNLENAGLPALDDAGLPEGFQVPGGIPPGILADGAKVFRIPVRVRDESVREIPPLEYAWFDPEAEAFRTTATLPIALSVRRGEMVGAEAVVGAADPHTDLEPGSDEPSETTSARPRFTLIGADLSIETDPELLARAELDRLGGVPLRGACYALAVLLVLGAAGLRARDRIAPEVRERRARLARGVREVDAASRDLSSVESLRSVAAALRAMQRESRRGGSAPIEGLDALLAECEDRIYAPAPAGEGAAALGERARELARRLAEAGR